MPRDTHGLDFPRLNRAELAVNRALATNRAPCRFDMPDGEWTFTLTCFPLVPLSRRVIDIKARIGGETVRLRCPWSLVERIVRAQDTDLPLSGLDSETVSMVLELAFQKPLESLEEILGMDAALIDMVPPKSTGGAFRAYLCLNSPQGTQYGLELFASVEMLLQLSRMMDSLPVESRLPEGIGFTMTARAGATTLLPEEYTSLSVGDAMLIEFSAPNRAILLSLNEHLAAAGGFTKKGQFYTVEPFSTGQARNYRELLMTDESQGPPSTSVVDEADLEDVPVRLVFELGRADLPLSELRSLAVGAPISLNRSLQSGVDILVNGRRIGGGDIVMLGDEVGVRIRQLNGTY